MRAAAVAIVMPTRNRAALLPRAIESVLQQTYEDWELIVADDASTDATRDVLRAFVARDARIRVVQRARGAGAAAARNAAVAATGATYIAFLDDDDEWLPMMLETQLAALRTRASSAVLAHAPYYEVDRSGAETLRAAAVASVPAAARLLKGNFLGASTVVVRRSAFHAAGGFDPRLPRLQDWDLWLRIARYGPFTQTPAPLARIHVTPGSISTDTAALVCACSLIFAGHAAAPKRERAELAFTLGHLLTTHGLVAEGRAWFRSALALQPLQLRRSAMFAVSLLGAGPYRRVAALHGAVSR